MMNDKTMKNTLLIVFLGAAVTSAERSITDFRVPPSSALNVGMALGMSGQYAKFPEYHDPNFTQRELGLRGGFAIGLNGFSENDNREIYGGLSMDFWPHYDKIVLHDTTKHQFYSTTSLIQKFLARSYINATDFSAAFSGDGNIDWDYSKNAEFLYDHWISGYFDAGFEFGYGRLRDGTNLWKALEIERILQEEEMISDDLTSDDILAIAQTINQLQKFVLSHEKYEKFYYQELENQFQELGIDWVPAFVWFKIKEVIDFEVIPRRFGYRAALGPYVTGSGFYFFEKEESGGNWSAGGDPRIYGRVSFQSAYPINHRLQFNQRGDIKVNEEGLDTGVGFDFDYRVSLRLEFYLANSFKYTSPGLNVFGEKMIDFAHDFVFKYYLEDNMTFEWNIRYNHRWSDDSRKFGDFLSTDIGFAYYLW
jgi:hypothetical protein